MVGLHLPQSFPESWEELKFPITKVPVSLEILVVTTPTLRPKRLSPEGSSRVALNIFRYSPKAPFRAVSNTRES